MNPARRSISAGSRVAVRWCNDVAVGCLAEDVARTDRALRSPWSLLAAVALAIGWEGDRRARVVWVGRMIWQCGPFFVARFDLSYLDAWWCGLRRIGIRVGRWSCGVARGEAR